jgi:lipopolysaccharide/colanic/teichoic acid biosynthesis glycosyltransferase
MLAAALAVKLEDGGTVFYSGIRIGKDGVPFKMHKFRTMAEGSDKRGGSSTADDDPRITGTGRILRKFKIDELPQMFNVLKGQMSVVGPRPEVPYYVNMFDESEKRILTVRPGVTDWASLENNDEGAILSGSPDPEKTYANKIRPGKLKLQLKYVDEHSFLSDMTILYKTAVSIIKRTAGK